MIVLIQGMVGCSGGDKAVQGIGYVCRISLIPFSSPSMDLCREC